MELEFIDKLKFLFEPAPYKIAYGGRGGGKSVALAQAALILGARKKLRIGCFREFQTSIKESVHELLSQEVGRLNLTNDRGDALYKVQETSIVGLNGTEFFFMGLRNKLNSIKSVHGIDIAWVEEAQTISKMAWDIFEPTIRGDAPAGPFNRGSEIWVGFNPELDTDETYIRFVKQFKLLPEGSRQVFINWYDNRFFPAILRRQMETMRKRDPISARTVWDGETRLTLDGAIFAKQIQDATNENRICSVDYVPQLPVDTYWDLGKGDHTSIWFIQRVGMRYNVIDFFEDRGEYLPYYVKKLQELKYNYGICYIPHDGSHTDIKTDKSVEAQLRKYWRVRVVPRVARKAISIEAARVVFDNCYFDRDKTSDGRQRLARYKFDIDKDSGQWSKEPLHDENSDAADAFQQIGLMSRANETAHQPKKKRISVNIHGHTSAQQSWMS